jgi:hypothetical protein
MSLCGRSKWVRFFIGEGTMPFGLARRFTRPVADLPQSAFAIAINFQSGPWRHLQWVDAYR